MTVPRKAQTMPGPTDPNAENWRAIERQLMRGGAMTRRQAREVIREMKEDEREIELAKHPQTQ